MDIPFALNADFVDSQYQQWKSDPNSIPRDWQIFFEGFDLGALGECRAAGICEETQVLRQSRVEQLIHRYRDVGHLLSCLDPLEACPIDHPLLSLAAFDLTEEDLERTFFVPGTFRAEQMPLREIVPLLHETYCRSIGVEYIAPAGPC